MPRHDEPQAPSGVLSLDMSGLLRQFREEAREAAREGARQGIAEAFQAQQTDRMLDSGQAALLLGYVKPDGEPNLPAFKMARGRNPELAALGVRLGSRWRFRRSDLEAWLSAHPRRSAKP
jgi:hypothetical protein